MVKNIVKSDDEGLNHEYFFIGLMTFLLLIVMAIGFIIFRYVKILGVSLVVFPFGFWIGYLTGKKMRGRGD
jgi:hypothetical protein